MEDKKVIVNARGKSLFSQMKTQLASISKIQTELEELYDALYEAKGELEDTILGISGCINITYEDTEKENNCIVCGKELRYYEEYICRECEKED